MTEDEFWRCSFRKMDALLAIHVKVNGDGDDEDAEPERLSLEELLSWG